MPKEFIGPAEKGIVEAMEGGVLAGYPMDDLRVTVYDGSYHDVDCSEMSFKIAGSMAFKDAVNKAKPVLLEPVMGVEVVVPDEYMGTVIGDLISPPRAVGRHRDARWFADHQGDGPAGDDVRICDRIAVAHARPRQLHDAFLPYEEAPASMTEEVVSRSQGKAREAV